MHGSAHDILTGSMAQPVSALRKTSSDVDMVTERNSGGDSSPDARSPSTGLAATLEAVERNPYPLPPPRVMAQVLSFDPGSAGSLAPPVPVDIPPYFVTLSAEQTGYLAWMPRLL